MNFTRRFTGQTTAVTDILLSIVAAGAICNPQWIESPETWKMITWSLAFGLMALGGVLGAFAHGLEMNSILCDVINFEKMKIMVSL